MKIYDYDEKFFEYARTWMAIHPGLTEDQVEEHYNEMLRSWLNAPAKWLGGQKPGEYFNRYSDPRDLMKLMEEYEKRDIGLPEPLYSRVVALGEACVPALSALAANEDKSEVLRATAIAMLRDIGGEIPVSLFVELVCFSEEPNELSEMAGEALAETDASVVDLLLERFDRATEYGQMLIMDICSNYTEDPRVYDRLVALLRNRPRDREMYAGLLGKLGDPRAIEPLTETLKLTDLSYMEYIEVRDAIEELGGDAGEERDFHGDPDFEAMRNL